MISEAKTSTALLDASVVSRCLEGDVQGWQQLYDLHHERLLSIVGRQLAILSPGFDVTVVEEIVARVWLSVVSADASLLRRFDATRGSSLGAYLAGLAKFEVKSWVRSEVRRRRREKMVAEMTPAYEAAGDSVFFTDEFLELLTPREREYLAAELLGSGPGEEYSDANRWQLSSRIRRKLVRYLADERAS